MISITGARHWSQAYGRALELDPGRLYSRTQSGGIHLALGASAEALAAFQAALELDPSAPASADRKRPLRCWQPRASTSSRARQVPI